MSRNRTKRQKAIIKRRFFLSLCAVLLIGVISLVVFAANAIIKRDNAKGGNTSSADSQSKDEVSSVVIPETTATVLSTGDIMVHNTQLIGAKTADGYDFSAFFRETSPYFKKVDLAIANLEVTFGGTESGPYSGKPSGFNAPDVLADNIKNSGINFLLTSNNHSNDTRLFGIKRTVQVLKQKGIEFTGTRELDTEPKYVIKEVNNIKIGIADYTYETPGNKPGRKYLNGTILAEEATNLVNSFSYNKIDEFYTEAQNVITEMKNSGAEFIVFYMHWGEEYKLNANTWQKTIAQKLSNLGVNIIVGSHPHVIEPIELIHSEDGQTNTVCLYSTGNFVSNQRQEIMKPECTTGHTEDGMLFTYTLKKNGDGTVLESINLIPTWVDRYKGGGGYLYTVYPLENPNDGSAKYGLTGTAATKSAKSYERTKAIVAAGLTECQNAIGCEVTFK